MLKELFRYLQFHSVSEEFINLPVTDSNVNDYDFCVFKLDERVGQRYFKMSSLEEKSIKY